ncbi:hypothetical protein IID23_01590 [Patescibacteria group bacterium]|nr:hypothetical protein [Patescibacteria group bacterium]
MLSNPEVTRFSFATKLSPSEPLSFNLPFLLQKVYQSGKSVANLGEGEG